MNATISEILKQAGYDCANDVKAAQWLFDQFSDYDALCTDADDLLNRWEEYLDFCETQESLGATAPTWEEWRKDE